VIAFVKSRYGRSHRIDDAYTFMSKDAAWLTACDVALENMEIRTAYRSLQDLYDGIARRRNIGLGTVFKFLIVATFVD